VDILAEFWILGHLIFLYPEGFTVFCGQEAEYTAYPALAEVVVADALLLLLLKGVRPATPHRRLFLAAIALGAAGMLFGVTTASPLSSVAVFLAAIGAWLGVWAFALWAALWWVIRVCFRRTEAPT